MPPLIAIVGCDGSGKTTVSEHILELARDCGPAAAAHLGKQQGNAYRWLSRLPLVGNWLENYIESRAAKVRTSLKVSKAPETLPAIVMFAFTLRRLRRFRRMLSLRQEGMIIIADRYPQLDFPRAFDGPDMSIDAQGNRFVQWLAAHEQRAFEWMSSFRPDLVIRLNVDLDTACARKPDHRRETLQKKIVMAPLLTFNGADITEIDATRPLADVLSEARAAVAQCLSARGYHSTEPPESGD